MAVSATKGQSIGWRIFTLGRRSDEPRRIKDGLADPSLGLGGIRRTTSRLPGALLAPGLGDVKAGMLEEDARAVAIGLLSPQLAAFFTSALILASSAAVSSFSAKAVGHMWPSSRFALSLKPIVAYLVLNF